MSFQKKQIIYSETQGVCIVENIVQISATTEEVTAAVQESAAITENNFEDAISAQEILTGVLEVSHRMDKYMN